MHCCGGNLLWHGWKESQFLGPYITEYFMVNSDCSCYVLHQTIVETCKKSVSIIIMLKEKRGMSFVDIADDYFWHNSSCHLFS